MSGCVASFNYQQLGYGGGGGGGGCIPQWLREKKEKINKEGGMGGWGEDRRKEGMNEKKGVRKKKLKGGGGKIRPDLDSN